MLPARTGTKTTIVKGGEEITLRGANTDEIEEVEEMVRQCARMGDGFNIDEFSPEDGHFLHKFILEPKVAIATGSNGTIKGAVICGLSTVPRVPGALYSAYFIVKESERRKGIGAALFEVVKELCRKDDCDMLFDVYLNNQDAIEWLKKNGFLVTGCLPHCGYVVNNGYTDSLLMSKELDKLNASDMISKL